MALVVAVSMAGLSYLWHGIVLTDIERMNVESGLFVVFFFFTYLVLGSILVGLIKTIEIDMRQEVKGMLLGGILGFSVYLIAFTLGFSFQENAVTDHLFFDFAWQMIEQAAGGFIAGYLFAMFPETQRNKQEFTFESLIRKEES